MTSSSFIHESLVYRLLQKHGIKVPKFISVKSASDLENAPFENGENVVIKGLADNLWHKSDVGALHFIPFSKEAILKLDHNMREALGAKYPWIETMVCSRSNFLSLSGLPSEGFVSIQKDDACSTVISFGVGGIHAEAWAQELHSNVLMWSPELTTPEAALEELKHHWLGKVWLGELRQGKKLTDAKKLLSFLKGLWSIALSLDELKIKLLEMNPVVIDQDGEVIALDGVGTYEEVSTHKQMTRIISPEVLLSPKKIAVAGVSENPGSFGRRILVNLLESSIKDLLVIKPGAQEFLGVKCYPDLKILLQEPVDALILVLPAAKTVATLIELCEQGSGAELVYIVAGGIGDSGDHSGLAAEVREILDSRRSKGLWTPALIGPNSLGVVIAPKNLSTLFIAPKKLPIQFHPHGNISFISQSGAFCITRLSREANLPIKYGYCVGNQMDLKVSDFLNVTATDKDISVFGVYLEGFASGEVLRFAKSARELVRAGKHVVLYKGGQSEEGMMAAAGHTGAMAGNYELQKKILLAAGIFMAESFLEFSSILNFLSAYPQFSKARNIAVISNAGFETVASADGLGGKRSEKRKNRLMALDEKTKSELQKVFETAGLGGLIGAANPLDLTPMADETIYLKSAEVFAHTNADAVLFCVVPLTDNLDTDRSTKIAEFAQGVKELAAQSKKPFIVVIDSGALYNNYREAFKKTAIPTFSSIEEAFLALSYER